MTFLRHIPFAQSIVRYFDDGRMIPVMRVGDKSRYYLTPLTSEQVLRPWRHFPSTNQPYRRYLFDLWLQEPVVSDWNNTLDTQGWVKCADGVIFRLQGHSRGGWGAAGMSRDALLPLSRWDYWLTVENTVRQNDLSIARMGFQQLYGNPVWSDTNHRWVLDLSPHKFHLATIACPLKSTRWYLPEPDARIQVKDELLLKVVGGQALYTIDRVYDQQRFTLDLHENAVFAWHLDQARRDLGFELAAA